MNAAADRNLLFGILAVQMDFISREALIGAMHAWMLEKTRPLGQILVAQQVLSAQRLELLDALVNEHLKQHGGDAQQSLRAVGSSHAAAAGLEQLADPEIQSSLAHLSSADEPPNPQPQQRPEQTLPLSAVTSAGTRFRIIRPWREGGLGKVSVAQDDELHREVALKEIKPAQARNKQSRDRFLLEAEITGSLEHPGIVPVYGLGHYGDGRPFYAMRFVRGDSLEEAIERFYGQESGARSQDSEAKSSRDSFQLADKSRRAADDVGRHSIAFRKLLGRFIDVCYAVDYAHSRGVLHRDLKPGNILLGKYGETLVVDWGLAKVLGKTEPRPQVIDETPLELHSGSGSSPTRMGVLIGTPAYMSPEQATGRLDLLGAASDVYSLGATLYCLLTGRPPFADEAVTVVLKRVQDGNFALPHQVRPNIPLPLEAVCLKAMSLRTEDRYTSPRRLADDIERWLADEPVSAYREPRLERLRRWGRRHRAVMTGAAALLITAVIALAISTGLIAREEAETDRQRIAAVTVRTESERQRQDAVAAKLQMEAINNFLIKDLLTAARPEEFGKDVTGALNFAAEKVEKAYLDQPLLEAAVRLAIGDSYDSLGLYPEAEFQLRRALQLYETHLGAQKPETLTAAHSLAHLLLNQGKLPESEALFRSTYEARRRILGPDHPDTLHTMNELARPTTDQGRLDESEKLLRECYERRQRVLGPEHRFTLYTLNDLAIVLESQGALAEAEKAYINCLEGRRRVLGEDHPDTIRAKSNWAYFLATRKGKLSEAEALDRECLEQRRRIQGPEHPETLYSLNNLSVKLADQGRMVEAEPYSRQAFELRRKVLGPKHPFTMLSQVEYGRVLSHLGKAVEAEPLLREAVDFWKTSRPRNQWWAVNAESCLGECLAIQGRYAEAEPLLLSSSEKFLSIPNTPQLRLSLALDRTVHLYEAWGKPAEAARWRDKKATP